jgi:two-component system cell cycle sensor histidine kinase/response regulator CckA
MGVDEAFRSSQGAYQAIFENTGTAMVVVGEDMKIMLVNSEMEKLTGYSKQELEDNKTWEDFISGEDLERMKDYHRRRRSGEPDTPSRYTFQSLDKQGHLKDVSISVTMLPGTSRTIASLIDISDLKRVERERRESEQRYRMLVEDLPALICRFRSDGTLIFANQNYCRSVDRSAGELMGASFFNFIPGEKQDNIRANFQSLTRRRPITTYERRITDPSGDVRWQEWTTRAIFDDQGELIEFQSLGQDITDRRRAEEEKEKVQAQLEQAQRMEAVGRLTAGFAHDCNNNLTVIIGFSDFLLNRISSRHELRGPVESIMGAAKRGAALTKQLLAFSRKQVLQPELRGINDLIMGTEEMMRRLLGEDIQMSIVGGEDLPLVYVDPVQMEQVIMNLVINARDAMPDGGKLLIETGTARHVAKESEHPEETVAGTCVTITVVDTGMGIAKETLPRIFEPFYTTKEAGKGTGLGLSMAYGIIKQSGGCIRVESSPGKGSRFTVVLPACREAAEPEWCGLQASEPLSGRETVLVVEDDEHVLNLMESLLRESGYTVLPAREGGEALTYLESHGGSIDLLVTDLVMPGMSGHDLSEKAKTANPNLKVLYVSGYPQDSSLIQELQRERKAFLSKPFGAGSFLKRIRELLR